MIDNVQDYREHIAKIQNTAENPHSKRCIKRELTYQQAFSIMLRSMQLHNEGVRLKTMRAAEKTKQIELCWEDQAAARSRASQNQQINRRDRFPRRK